MDPHNFFRHFFGFHSHRNEGESFFKSDEYDEDDFFQDDPFRHIFESMEQQMEAVQQHMEDIFKHFSATPFLPALEDPRANDPHRSPRDEMLKQPDSENPLEKDSTQSLFEGLFPVPRWDFNRPHMKGDTALDEEVKKKGLSAILDKDSGFSQRTGMSVTTIRRGDGLTEERKTIRYSDGREETIVTRRMGDKSHIITSKRYGDNVETSETFENMDEKDLPSFERRWNNPGGDSEPQEDLRLPQKYGQSNKDHSLLWKLFGLFSPKTND